MNKIRISAILAAALLLLPELLAACPNCKEAYMAEGQTPVSNGFGASIYFLMTMPFIVVGIFTFRLWLAQRHRGEHGLEA